MHHKIEQRAQPLTFRARGGQVIAVRRVAAADTPLLADLLGRLSDDARRLRYMSARYFSSEVSWNEAVRMAQGHGPDHVTLVAMEWPNVYDEVVAVAELVRDRNDRAAGEIALVVQDDMQRQGVGGFLLRCLVDLARARDITRLSASMLAENKAMLRLIAMLGLPYQSTTSYGETQALVMLPQHHGQLPIAQAAGRLAA